MCANGAALMVRRGTGADVVELNVAMRTETDERRRAQEALRESEEKFRTVMEFSFDVYWETDEQHRFVVQEFAHGLADAPAASEIGKARWEIPYLAPGEDAWREHRAMLDAHQPFRDFEVTRPTPCGGSKHVSVSGWPRFDANGRFIGYRGVGRHVTDRKRAEEERARLERRVRQAETMEVIGRFASGMAHDFNNVLGGILCYSEMILEDAPKDSSCAHHAAGVRAAALRARDLVRDILAYARGAAVKRAPLDLRAPALEAIALARDAAPSGVQLTSDVTQGPLLVNGEATQLYNVVTNLCTNAIHAMSGQGRVHIQVRREECVEARGLSHGDLKPHAYAVISVEDSGCGMDEATLGRIFEPFFTTKHGGSGCGLGLAAVHSIVSQYEGAIDVKSAPGAGTRFDLYLPEFRA